MKKVNNRIISAILTVIMLSSLFMIPLTAREYSYDPLTKWKLSSVHYNDYTFGIDPKTERDALFAGKTTDDQLAFSTGTANSFDDWYHTVSATPDRDIILQGFHRNMLSNNKGLSIKFKLVGDMKFGNMNGYNGMVSFAFYTPNSAGESMDNGKDIIPNNLHYSNYMDVVGNYYTDISDKVGGLGTNLAKGPYGTTGFAITFYPASDGSDAGTKRCSYYRLCKRLQFYENYPDENSIYYENSIVSEGYLDTPVDFSESCELKLNYAGSLSDRGISLSLNGELIDYVYWNRFPESPVGFCYIPTRMSMAAMGAWDSSVAFRIETINNIPAYHYCTEVGEAVDKFGDTLIRREERIVVPNDNVCDEETLDLYYEKYMKFYLSLEESEREWLSTFPELKGIYNWYTKYRPESK